MTELGKYSLESKECFHLSTKLPPNLEREYEEEEELSDDVNDDER